MGNHNKPKQESKIPLSPAVHLLPEAPYSFLHLVHRASELALEHYPLTAEGRMRFVAAEGKQRVMSPYAIQGTLLSSLL